MTYMEDVDTIFVITDRGRVCLRGDPWPVVQCVINTHTSVDYSANVLLQKWAAAAVPEAETTS